MSHYQPSALQQEWTVLQNQFDSYEKCSLAIKLSNVLLTCLLLFAFEVGAAALIFSALLWLQDGIWKTFQSRIGQQLAQVELAMQTASPNEQQAAMQFNLAWSQTRPNALGLVVEYIKQSLKPTVAYPHVLLVVFILWQYLFA